MTATNLLKSLLFAALLSCASAYAEDVSNSAGKDGTSASSFKISALQCQVVDGQIRCTFG